MQFDPEIATIVGVDCAIMLSNIEFWVDHNRREGNNEREGKFWTYNSARAFAELFPFWTEKQIRRILRSLTESGYIVRKNFNKKGYDQTGWYTLPDENLHLTEREDTTSQVVTPIPDIKPDNKQQIKTYVYDEVIPSTELSPAIDSLISEQKETTEICGVRTDGQLPMSRGKTYILRVLSVYRDLYRDLYGCDPTVNIGRFGKSLKSLVETKNELQIAALLITFFNWRGISDESDFDRQKLIASAHNPQWFFSTINQYEIYLRNVRNLEFDDNDKILEFVAKNLLSIKK